MAKANYTFGDTDEASLRLRRLAELYEPETRELLRRGGVRSPRLAVDLGCGPGWSTRLLRDVLSPHRTVGLDTSKRFIAEALRNHGAHLEFHLHDIRQTPFPVPAPDVLFCRFLLTHLGPPRRILRTFAAVAAPRALLFAHEMESLETGHPVLRRYYELVGQLQRHYEQTLLVGEILEASFQGSGWSLVESRRRNLEKLAKDMASLHLANLRTWRNDAYAARAFDPHEIAELEASLGRIARGDEEAGVVVNAARQIIAQRL